jgi:hypothetical protein
MIIQKKNCNYNLSSSLFSGVYTLENILKIMVKDLKKRILMDCFHK